MFEKRRRDALLDAYIGWREACAGVRAAYSAWTLAPRANQSPAFRVYVAALDDEEDAAYEYAKRLTEVCNQVWPRGLVAPRSSDGLSGSRATSARRGR
jgi:hypothetical protein